MRFRPHRGMLADSLRETVEVLNAEALTAHLIALYPDLWHAGRPSIVIKPYGVDPRTDWEYTYIVEADGYGVLGFCDRAIP